MSIVLTTPACIPYSFSDTFTTLDTSKWFVGPGATHQAGRMSLNPLVIQQGGYTIYNPGTGLCTVFTLEFTFEIGTNLAPPAATGIFPAFFGSNVFSDGFTPDDGYRVDYNHNTDAITLYNRTGASSVQLATVAQVISDTPGSIHTGKIQYDDGDVTIFFNGSSVLTHTIVSPDETNTGISFGAWGGNTVSNHYLNDVTITMGSIV